MLLALCVVLAIAVAGCGKKEKKAVAGTKPGAWYVALGDSGTSGPGITPVADAGCVRSAVNYPHLLAKKLDVPSFTDVSCGGAKTQNVLTKPQTNKGGEHPLQLAAVGKSTRLVTIGIGLNDYGLSYLLLYQCLETGGKTNKGCQTYLDAPDANFAPYLDRIGDNVTAVVKAVRTKAPKARVVLIGYPRYLPDTGSCPALVPMPEKALERARTVLADVTARYRRIAAETGALFADTYDASTGHDVCSADPWVHGIDGSATDGAQLHPYPAYHRAVADLVADLLEKKQ